MSVSIFIQTLNEEQNLPGCLKALQFSDDIVVLDSWSTDGTEKVARSAGARFFQRKYNGRAANQNWAMENIDFKYPWVYYSDADEIVTPELAREIVNIVQQKDRPEVLFRVRFKNMFMDRWIKRSSLYPTWVSRLFRPGKVRWERGANPITIVDGLEGRLEEHFLHYSFSKGIEVWLDKHRKYAAYEAVETIKELKAGKIDWPGMSSSDVVRRRLALKKASFRLPFRPAAKFLYMYFLRLGILDGHPGAAYCLLQAKYECMICAEVRRIGKEEKTK